MIRNIIVPAPGNIVVVREFVEEYVSKIEEVSRRTRGKEKGILRPDADRDYAQHVNPWALVVGVGDPRPTQYGTTITTNVKPGDKVMVAQIGRNIEIETPDGEKEMLYVLPFEGVTAIMKWECSVCHSVYGAEPEGRRCPAGCVDIDRPTISQTMTITKAN